MNESCESCKYGISAGPMPHHNVLCRRFPTEVDKQGEIGAGSGLMFRLGINMPELDRYTQQDAAGDALTRDEHRTWNGRR